MVYLSFTSMGFFDSITDTIGGVFGGGSVAGTIPNSGGSFGGALRFAREMNEMVKVFPESRDRLFSDPVRRYDGLPDVSRNEIKYIASNPATNTNTQVDVNASSGSKINYKTVALVAAGGIVLYMVMKRK